MSRPNCRTKCSPSLSLSLSLSFIYLFIYLFIYFIYLLIMLRTMKFNFIFVFQRVILSQLCCNITKTHLYNFDPLKPHFYIGKLGFTGVYIIFLISAQKHRLWYSLEPPRLKIFSIYLNRRVFVMICSFFFRKRCMNRPVCH